MMSRRATAEAPERRGTYRAPKSATRGQNELPVRWLLPQLVLLVLLPRRRRGAVAVWGVGVGVGGVSHERARLAATRAGRGGLRKACVQLGDGDRAW